MAVGAWLSRSAPACAALVLSVAIAAVLTGPALLGRAALGPDALLDWDPLYRQGALPVLPRQGDYTPIVIDYPRDLAVARGLAAGRLDAWNPLAACGAPLWAEQGGPFFPLKLPFYLAPSRETYNLFLALRLVLAGFGAYLLARARGLGPVAALAAGGSFEVSGAMIANLPFGAASPTYVLPWVVLGGLAVARRPSSRTCAGAGCALGLAAHGGHPTLALLAFAAFAAAAAGESTSFRQTPRAAVPVAGWAGLAVLIGLALGAPVLLPLAELSMAGATYKSGEVGEAVRAQTLYQSRIGLPIALFAPRLIERLFGFITSLHPFSPAVGVLTLTAATAGILRGALDRALLAVLLLGIALSLAPPVLGWIALVPGPSLILPTYAGSLIALVLTQAAGSALHDVRAGAKRTNLPLALALVLVCGTAALLLGGWIPALSGVFVHFAIAVLDGGLMHLLLPPAVAAAVSFAAVGLIRSGRAREAAMLLGAAMVIDQTAAMLPLTREPASRRLAAPPSEATSFLQNRLAAQDARMIALPFMVGYPMTPMLFALPDFRSVAALPVRRFRDYLDAISPGASAFTLQEVKRPTSPLLDLASVRDVVVARTPPPGSAHRRLLVPAALPDPSDADVATIYRDAALDVYENRAALPRFRIVHEAAPVADAAAALAWLRAAADGRAHAHHGELGKRIVVEPDERGNEPPVASGAARPEERVRLVDATDPDRLRLEATLATPGYVVIADTYYPGWSATVDGQPASIHPADLLFRAVHVPEGTHAIELVYEPESLYWGFVLTAVAGLVCVILLRAGGTGWTPIPPQS